VSPGLDCPLLHGREARYQRSTPHRRGTSIRASSTCHRNVLGAFHNTWAGSMIATMGFTFRKRVRTGRSSWLNLSGSGVSASKRVGRDTLNSRGGGRIRILPGLAFRFGRRR